LTQVFIFILLLFAKDCFRPNFFYLAVFLKIISQEKKFLGRKKNKGFSRHEEKILALEIISVEVHFIESETSLKNSYLGVLCRYNVSNELKK